MRKQEPDLANILKHSKSFLILFIELKAETPCLNLLTNFGGKSKPGVIHDAQSFFSEFERSQYK